MMTIKKILFISVFFISLHLSAQHEDLASWTEAGVEFNLPKKFTLGVSEQIKYEIETGELYGIYSGVELDYKWNKHFHTAAEYRLRTIPNAFSQRLAATASYKNDIGEFGYTFKTKVQYDIKPDKFETSAWRNKITVKYEGLKDLKPYLSYEVFYALSFKGSMFDKIRPEAGLKYELGKKNEFTLYYLVDKAFNESEPTTLYVLGASYLYKF